MIYTEGTIINVQEGKSYTKNFNDFQVKPFYPRYEQNLYQFKSYTQFDKFVTAIIQSYDSRGQEFITTIEKEMEGFFTEHWK